MNVIVFGAERRCKQILTISERRKPLLLALSSERHQTVVKSAQQETFEFPDIRAAFVRVTKAQGQAPLDSK